jgi:hypothetical protein
MKIARKAAWLFLSALLIVVLVSQAGPKTARLTDQRVDAQNLGAA